MNKLYQTVTNNILAQLEAGVRPWTAPWQGGGSSLPLRANGTPYRGVNVVLLWSAMIQRGYTQRHFMTFKQALAEGACVRKGERATPVVYYGQAARTDDDGEVSSFRFLKSYYVFNVDQIDGLDAKWFSPDPGVSDAPVPLEPIEKFFNSIGASVRHGDNRAYYVPSQDVIMLPEITTFRDAAYYYATRSHETIHWTGSKARLARTFGKRFGDSTYAAEELVAEMGAAFLCADLGLASEPREDHASYLAAWIKILKSDNRAIFTAASAAQAACDYIHDQTLQKVQKAA